MMRRAPPLRHAQHDRPGPPPRRQQGIALFIVIVLVLLSMLLALWASRSALFNELVVGNDADYQRAFEAAQALLLDAELDIRGERANGQACEDDASKPSVCRRGNTTARFPLEAKEVQPLLAFLDAQAGTKCRDALCAKRTGPQDFWNNTDASQGPTLAQMAAAGARYGQYTGAITGSNSNPILAEQGGTDGGWYWIEVLPHDPQAGNAGLVADARPLLPLHMAPQVLYRVTALARGRKAGTQVVLQQTYARQRMKN
ncbi:Tfp pilus assembly protein PilX [Delftia tsuruhatensis]|uniref:pilus assembly PilX family protein n=1 Tax=Delftia tsuruhatensis TaxID=180282 RepID=UPI001E6F09EE|nr:pilus assembly protein [Delftia tsuruhatensis]CAB5656685.1 Tfp pilus assembly protein PilX [Delftia tsuruhatensis]CAC9679008.1 Tfp pilus assembly protein PilX [Delftia tsuruhatensis]